MTDFNAHVVLGESLTPVGQLRFTQAGPRQFSTFAYDPAWIENLRAFAVQPGFPIDAGPFQTSGQPGNMRDALAGVFADAAPDSWGLQASRTQLWQRPFRVRVLDAVR
ncbi:MULTISPECIES: HipA N-terminal domain-containing protein [unclassified Neorhizobium]|uniref:HipA N-terminal domain-containing protein n=1 Tax=unclassified Neorhizobium TaxID=2629175 RepID=UPI001FF5B62D|nr:MULTISPECIES: HipA N-terminal domain-containing protein [unclassified Neorhizobium]MCJ9669008.1 HipA N-terminal domain-containing protein [Neorhizobium sp. SHOUNA12B]MCJ9744962.1 HipA N-terminal domain-containing protein [Neorhizobium sp. SHOUNA12A]